MAAISMRDFADPQRAPRQVRLFRPLLADPADIGLAPPDMGLAPPDMGLAPPWIPA